MTDESKTMEPDSRHLDALVRPRNGIEVRPVFLSDFDRYDSRGWHQVRISLWGWPAALVEWLMLRNWRKRNMSPDRPNTSLTGREGGT